jgi:spermidine synthase
MGNGGKFMGEFDAITTDSPDPVGPAESLFGEEYYKLVKRSLRSGGIACSQVSRKKIREEQIEKKKGEDKGAGRARERVRRHHYGLVRPGRAESLFTNS